MLGLGLLYEGGGSIRNTKVYQVSLSDEHGLGTDQ